MGVGWAGRWEVLRCDGEVWFERNKSEDDDFGEWCGSDCSGEARGCWLARKDGMVGKAAC